MRVRYQLLSLGGLFFLFLFLLWLRFFSGHPAPSAVKVVSPTPLSGAAEVLGKGAQRPSPFGDLLRSWAGSDEGASERSEGGGLISLFLKTVADEARVTTAPAATTTRAALPTPTATPEVLGYSATPTPAPTVDQQQVGAQVALWNASLVAGNYAALYQMMSQEFRRNFSLVDFQKVLTGGSVILHLELGGTPQVLGDWAEAPVKVTLLNGSTPTYRAVFHWEGSGWYLFGTD